MPQLRDSAVVVHLRLPNGQLVHMAEHHARELFHHLRGYFAHRSPLKAPPRGFQVTVPFEPPPYTVDVELA